MSILSIVIPAHDEGPLLRRNLERMLRGTSPGEFEVVVVANGCTDDTAQQAAAVPGVRVVEIAEASKIAALNAGDAAVTVFPRAYLDADVEISARALRAVASELASAEGPLVAAPTLNIDASRSTFAVRAYYRVWELSDYRAAGHVGSGLYAVNEAGRARWAEFPAVIADDRFVQQRFRPEERASLPGHSFTVAASSDMTTHIRRGARIMRGNRELPVESAVAARVPAVRRYSSLLRRVAAVPARWIDLPFYVYGFGMTSLRARPGQSPAPWARDESLRQAARA